MGKRTREFYKMMEQYKTLLNQAMQPNEWERRLGDEVTKRLNRSNKDIMAENLGTLGDWQRRYQAGLTPESSVKSKGYGLALGMARDVGAEELARDYGRLGEQSVLNDRATTLGLLGNQQQIASNRTWSGVQGAMGGAQMYNAFRPPEGMFDRILRNAGQMVGIARGLFSPLSGGG